MITKSTMVFDNHKWRKNVDDAEITGTDQPVRFKTSEKQIIQML